MGGTERDLSTWELIRLEADRARLDAQALREAAAEARARAEIAVTRAELQVKRSQRLRDRITVHFADSFEASDLAWQLAEHVEVIERPDGTDAEGGATRTLVA